MDIGYGKGTKVTRSVALFRGHCLLNNIRELTDRCIVTSTERLAIANTRSMHNAHILSRYIKKGTQQELNYPETWYAQESITYENGFRVGTFGKNAISSENQNM